MKFIFGIIVGMLVAGFVVVMINKQPSAFVNKDFNATIILPNTKESVESYTFYDVLQSNQKIAESKTAEKTPDKITALESKTAEKTPDKITDKTVEKTIFVQVGAFEKSSGAEELNAKLLLMGYDTTVKADNNVYRVLIGPMDYTKAEAIIKELNQQNITAVLER